MNPYEQLAKDRAEKEKEKQAKTLSLEKQLKQWEARQKELRAVALTALDPAFVRRQLDRCSEEIKRINQILSTM